MIGERKHLFSIFCVMSLFAAGAIGYWTFSADRPDGLEQTMSNAGVGEPEPVYDAPFDYGGDYLSFLATGAVGFAVVLLVSIAISKLMAKEDETQPGR